MLRMPNELLHNMTTHASPHTHFLKASTAMLHTQVEQTSALKKEFDSYSLIWVVWLSIKNVSADGQQYVS